MTVPCRLKKKKTDNVLYSIWFSTEDILMTINNLDFNKANGHDEISIKMLKLCGCSVFRPLQIICKSYSDRGKFPQQWGKANIVSLHEKMIYLKRCEIWSEIRGVPLDILQGFDKVWHKGLVFILKQEWNGKSGKLLNISEDVLRNRKQSVVLNGHRSNWENIHAGVPQGSILGPLLIYINNLAENLSSNPQIIAGDTSSFSVVLCKRINDPCRKVKA